MSKRIQFVSSMRRELTKLGAKELPTETAFICVPFEIETRAGMFTIEVDTDVKHVISICGRFKDIKKANEVFGKEINLNRFSGKYNHHLASELTTIPDAVEYFTERIKELL